MGVGAPTTLQDEDSDEERGLLRLDGKRKSTGGKAPKPKRTKDDIKMEEIEKLEKEVTSVIESLQSFPDSPSGQNLGRIDRMLNKKAKDFKSEHDFQSHEKVERLSKKIDVLRSCVKLATAMMGTNATRKKAKNDFLEKFEMISTAHVDIYQRFPQSIKQTYVEHVVPKLVEEQNWDKIADTVSEDAMEELYGRGNPAVAEQSVAIFEGLMGHILSKHEKACENSDITEQHVKAAASDLAQALTATCQHI